MGRDKISGYQLIILLYVCRSFNLFNASLQGVGTSFGLIFMAAFPLAAVFQVLLMLPVYWLNRISERSLPESATYAMGKWSIWYPVLSCGYLLLTAGVTVRDMTDFMVNAVFPDSSALFFIVTLVLAAGYAATLGVEGIARAALIVFVLFTLGLLLVFFGVANRIDLINVRPFLEGDPVKSVIEGAWAITGRSSTIFVYALLLPRVRSKGKRSFLYYLLFAMIAQEVVTFLISSVLGELAFGYHFPLYALTTIAQISIFQRMDAIHLSIWVMVCFLRVALDLWVCKELLVGLLPDGERNKRRRFLLPFLMTVVIVWAGVLTQNEALFRKVNALLSSGIPLILVLTLSPLIIIAVTLVRRRTRKGGASHEAL